MSSLGVAGSSVTPSPPPPSPVQSARPLTSRSLLVGGEKDYVQWLAHSDDISDPSDGCMLGYKERFLRMRKDSVCWNGRDYIVTKQPTPCPCTLDDFLWYGAAPFPRCAPVRSARGAAEPLRPSEVPPSVSQLLIRISRGCEAL